MSIQDGILEYHGCNYFKQRLILSILSGKPIKIRNIRPSKGLQEFEVRALRVSLLSDMFLMILYLYSNI